MLSGLLKISGMLVLKIVYGKEYSEKAEGKIGLMLLLSAINIFWLLSILFLAAGIAANDTAFCIVMAAGYPVAIAAWTIVARKKAVVEINVTASKKDATMDSPFSSTYETNGEVVNAGALVAPSPQNAESEGLSPMPKIRFCRNCGFELIEESEFCSRCGNKIEREAHQ